jgi:hypothetical protein
MSLKPSSERELSQAPMDVVDVLRNMVSLCAAITSYRDTGYVPTTISKSGVVHRRSFSTLYQQPSLFRFTFFSPHPHPPLAHIVTEHAAEFASAEATPSMSWFGQIEPHHTARRVPFSTTTMSP